MSDQNESHAKATTANPRDDARMASEADGVVSRASDSAGTVAPIRRMTMTPLEPRTAGGLKGFGFTVRFDDPPEAA